MNKFVDVSYYTGAGIFFAQSAWSLVMSESRDLFIQHLQTALLFLTLATLSKLIKK